MNQFTFFKNYFDIVEELQNEEDKNDFLRGIIDYIFKDIEPDFTGEKRFAWLGIKSSLDTSKNRGNNNQKKSNENQTKIKKNQTKIKKNQKKSNKNQTSSISTSISTSYSISLIIKYLNTKLDSTYKETTKKTKDLITARLKEGFTVDDFKTVINKKYAEWNNTDFEKYLRPETLFSSKFEGYLNQKSNEKKSAKEIIEATMKRAEQL